jgi:hypothetical protein
MTVLVWLGLSQGERNGRKGSIRMRLCSGEHWKLIGR